MKIEQEIGDETESGTDSTKQQASAFLNAKFKQIPIQPSDTKRRRTPVTTQDISELVEFLLSVEGVLSPTSSKWWEIKLQVI